MTRQREIDRIIKVLCREISNAHCTDDSKLLIAKTLINNDIGTKKPIKPINYGE